MAISISNNGGSEETPTMSEINVTPLVDVMLVLLIIFMVAAPMMTIGVPVNLPKAAAKPLTDQKPPIVVSVNADSHIFIDTAEVSKEELVQKLIANSENAMDRRIHVRADKDLSYGTVLETMGMINSAGFTKVALVSQLPATAPASAAPSASIAGAQPAAPAAGGTPPSAQAVPASVAAAPAGPTAPGPPLASHATP